MREIFRIKNKTQRYTKEKQNSFSHGIAVRRLNFFELNIGC